jgi:dephospho-CoA kinase
MRIIGLTGGIGSGKSTVAHFLEELGATVLNFDEIGHEVQKKHTETYDNLVDAFGKDILAQNDEIDRFKLGRVVFNDKKALKRLNAIVHPAIDSFAANKISEFRQNGVKVLVVDAAAILDTGKRAMVDEIWITIAPKETIIKRLHERSGYTQKESEERINSQISDNERIKNADVVINTDCSLDELKERVKAEWDKLQKRL